MHPNSGKQFGQNNTFYFQMLMVLVECHKALLLFYTLRIWTVEKNVDLVIASVEI